MLSIGKLGAGQERYYTEKVAEGAEDYYSGEGEAEGYWLGDAAGDLGLQGKVDADQLTAMLTGHDPATGAPLGLRHVGGRGPVPGFDLTFSAPKSVSLLWALGGPEIAGQVREAQRESLAAAFDYMQREACWTRRGHGGAEFVRGNGFLATAFEHRSSRAGDPQLHTHVLIANATKGPDGRWTRLYHPAIYEHAKTAGYLFPTRAEARTWRADAIRAPGRTTKGPSTGGDLTLAEALGLYVEGMSTGRVRPKGRERYKPNTTRSYERVVRVYIAPSTVGPIKVARLRRRDLQEFADELHAADLSAATISNILNPVQAFFRRAIDRDELSYNPSERIDLPHGRSKRPKRIASKEEAATLLAVLDATVRAVWATAFYAGLRRGELQALRVCDIDFEAHLIAVERGWDQVEGVIEPKSDAGRRTVPMLAILADCLAEDLRRTGRNGEDLVFGRTTEQAFYASTIDYGAKKAWKAARAADEEPTFPRPITLHECRHTFASLLIDAGANPKAIQQFMGHSKIQTTFDVYGHLLPGSHDEVRERMDSYLRGKDDE